MEIKGKTAYEVWKKILGSLLDEGSEYNDRRERVCKEILNLTATIGSTEGILRPIEILNYFNKWVYPAPAEIKDSILGKDDVSEYYYNYGERAFKFYGMSQMDDYVIPLLKKTPTSKRAIVIFYDPAKDSLLDKKETPGLVMVNFNIRNGKIETSMVIRSNDMFHGWVANIVQAYYLAEYLSRELNYPIGNITTHSISAHIFDTQFDDIKKVLGR